MRNSLPAAAAVVAFFVACLACRADDAPALPGDLVSLDATKKEVEVKAGDLLQLAVLYRLAPDQMVENLKIEVQGDAVKEVGVVKVQLHTAKGEPDVANGEISAFLKAEKPGDATVKITPVGKDKHEPFEFKVKVGERKK